MSPAPPLAVLGAVSNAHLLGSYKDLAWSQSDCAELAPRAKPGSLVADVGDSSERVNQDWCWHSRLGAADYVVAVRGAFTADDGIGEGSRPGPSLPGMTVLPLCAALRPSPPPEPAGLHLAMVHRWCPQEGASSARITFRSFAEPLMVVALIVSLYRVLPAQLFVALDIAVVSVALLCSSKHLLESSAGLPLPMGALIAVYHICQSTHGHTSSGCVIPSLASRVAVQALTLFYPRGDYLLLHALAPRWQTASGKLTVGSDLMVRPHDCSRNRCARGLLAAMGQLHASRAIVYHAHGHYSSFQSVKSRSNVIMDLKEHHLSILGMDYDIATFFYVVPTALGGRSRTPLPFSHYNAIHDDFLFLLLLTTTRLTRQQHHHKGSPEHGTLLKCVDMPTPASSAIFATTTECRRCVQTSEGQHATTSSGLPPADHHHSRNVALATDTQRADAGEPRPGHILPETVTTTTNNSRLTALQSFGTLQAPFGGWKVHTSSETHDAPMLANQLEAASTYDEQSHAIGSLLLISTTMSVLAPVIKSCKHAAATRELRGRSRHPIHGASLYALVRDVLCRR
ncbi:hypothetical protein DOTSEDRAFT_83475 [Dothistroma septosporum NZE10]|uniref:Uncharacterized protein n=1 Tax=Dothistroma septosporum (strain NZE10 / CBS 128990) TaxID=675120 RepID=M2XH45_DOTSN|nr:hypothetical protein DOTSEDRAFT_83475 [Dothistroma septosporum NZE10]